VHVSTKSVVLVSGPVEALPEVALLPVQPPEAVHELARFVLQLSVADLPESMEVGLATNDTVGGFFADADADAVAVTPWVVVPPPAAVAVDTPDAGVETSAAVGVEALGAGVETSDAVAVETPGAGVETSGTVEVETPAVGIDSPSAPHALSKKLSRSGLSVRRGRANILAIVSIFFLKDSLVLRPLARLWRAALSVDTQFYESNRGLRFDVLRTFVTKARGRA
jgi:hypothetical protein